MDEDSLAVRIGARLRLLRRRQKLTLAALSQACGVSVSYLSAVEKGVNHPSLQTLAAVTEALGVTIPEVLAQEGQATVTRARLPEHAPGSVTISHPLLSLRACAVSATAGEHGACPVDLEERNLFLYVVTGSIVVHIDGEEFALGPGDALDATLPGEVSWTSHDSSTVTWTSCPSRHG
jgi:transcriptional regulator with XRE-family HTH domain